MNMLIFTRLTSSCSPLSLSLSLSDTVENKPNNRKEISLELKTLNNSKIEYFFTV
jgi:hypothetical protein